MAFFRRVIRASLDSPAERAECAGAIEVSGWGYSSKGSIESVDVSLAGRRLGAAAYGLPRPDVAAMVGGANSDCGFRERFVIDVAAIGSGRRELVVRLADTAGNIRSLQRSVIVVPGAGPRIHGALDTPTELATCPDGIEVHGWCFSTASPIESVEVFFEDKKLGAAAYGTARPDIASTYREAPSANCGFHARFAIDLAAERQGRRTLRVRVADRAGNTAAFERAILLAAAKRIYASLDLPAEHARCAGAIEVAGWAFSNAARIERVEAYLDERPLGAVPYGEQRPEIAVAYPQAPSTACGFADRFRLDVRQIGLGPRTLTVKIADGAGTQHSFERTVVVAPAPAISGSVDVPAEHSGCVDAVEVWGWAASSAGPVDRVEVFLDDVKLGDAVYGYERLDVVVDQPHADSDKLGFYERFALDSHAGGKRMLRVRVADRAGNVAVFERSIVVGAGADGSSADVFFPTEIDDLMDRARTAIEASTQHGSAATDGSSAPVHYLRVSAAVTLDEIRGVLHKMGRSLDDAERVLDFGCASHSLLADLLAASGKDRIVGVTTSDDATARARSWALDLPILRVGARPPMAMPDERFDVVIDSRDTLKRLDEPESRAWLEEIRRVMRPGGLALVRLEVNRNGSGAGDGAFHAPWQIIGPWKAFFETGACLVAARGISRSWLILRRKPQTANADTPALQTPAFAVRPATSDEAIVRAVVVENEYRLPASFAPQDVVIDIGAHIGSFSWAAASRGAGVVHAYEPDPGNWQRAREVLEPFGDRVRVDPIAVWRSDRSEEALALSSYERVGGLANTGSPGVMSPGAGAVQIPCTQFDRVVGEHAGDRGGRLRLVKLDCEGSEYPILYTSRCLDRIDALCGEYHNVERVLGSVPEIARVPGFDGYDGLALCAYLRERGFIVDLMPRGEMIGLFFAYRPESSFRFQ